MSHDYKPRHGGALNPMQRSAFYEMHPKDQSQFCLLGGHVIDDPEPEKQDEVIASRFGATMLKADWDALPLQQQMQFIMRDPAEVTNE